MPHITFIHGISNKPAKDALAALWLRALARENANNKGYDCNEEGVTTSMVYWADVMYPEPEADVEQLEAANEMLEAEREAAPGVNPPDPHWRERLGGAERDFVESLADRLGADVPPDVAPPNATTSTPAAVGGAKLSEKEREAVAVLERVPLPWFIKGPLMKVLLRDVHHYLFNVDYSPRPDSSFRVQDEIRRRFVDAVKEGATKPGPHIVISHSMGTVIAYDCLRRVPDCPAVDALMTIGSPLGLDEVQDKLRPEWSRRDGFPPNVRGRWVNIYDSLDPVAGFDPKFANDYMRGGASAVEDVNENNWGRWRHSITKYLQGTQLRAHLRELLA